MKLHNTWYSWRDFRTVPKIAIGNTRKAFGWFSESIVEKDGLTIQRSLDVSRFLYSGVAGMRLVGENKNKKTVCFWGLSENGWAGDRVEGTSY